MGRTGPSGPSTEQVLRWAGFVLVTLAAVTLVGTAISRGWIGPELQLAGAAAIGVALLAGSARLRTERPAWALASGVGGAVVLPVCAGATSAALDLLVPVAALALLVVSVVAVVGVARRWSLPPVATVGLVVAMGVTGWIADEADDLAPLAPGLVLVAATVGASIIGWWWGWRPTRLISVAVGSLFLLGFLTDAGPLDGVAGVVAVVGLGLTGVVAWFGPMVTRVVSGSGDGLARAIDRRAVLPVPIWTWLAVSSAIGFVRPGAYAAAGFLVAALAAGSALGSGLLGRTRTDVPPLTLSPVTTAAQGAGAAFTALFALVRVVDAPAGLVATAVTALVIGLLARYARDVFAIVVAAAVGAIALLGAFVLIVDGFFDRPSAAALVATAVIIALLVGVAVLLRWWDAQSDLVSAFIAVAWGFGLGWVVGALVHGPQGQVLVSLVWAIAAIAALVVGILIDRLLYRALGLTTLALVLVKLLTVDLAEVDPLWRVGLFLVIGLGLLRVGYLLPKLSARAAARLR